MAQKVQGFSQAVGYWGRNPNCRLNDDQTAAKIRALLQDQLILNGRPVWLWQPVLPTTPGVVPCTCDKNTTQNSDYKCMSCFGTKLAPGYTKFMFETLFFCSAEASLFTMTGAAIDTTKKPSRIVCAPGSVSAVITTPDKVFANSTSEDWELELAAYRKTAGDIITLESSTDAGVTYLPVPLTPAVVGPPTAVSGSFYVFRGALTGAFKPIGTGTLRFRITLTRAVATTAESPSFEIVRVRHLRRRAVNKNLLIRHDYLPGQILVLKTWEAEVVRRESVQGRVVEHEGDRSWTAPLDFYDTTITRDTPPAALDDREAGPHPFFEYSSGVRLLQRYAIKSISFDSTVNNMLTHQSFTERRTQSGELYSAIW